MTKSGLYLAKVMDKNWGLYLVNQSPEIYIKLKEIFFHEKDLKTLNFFFQSDSDCFHKLWEQTAILEAGKTFDSSFLFIEFWTDDQNLILDESMKIANKLGLELRMDFN